MTQDLKEKLSLSFYSQLLTSFGNDRDFDDDLADELADVAIEEFKELTEREAKLITALEFYASEDG